MINIFQLFHNDEEINFIKKLLSNIKYFNIEESEEINNKKYFFNSENKYITLKESNMRKYYHLDNILKNNNEKLKKYDIIMFLRIDMFFEDFKILEKKKLKNLRFIVIPTVFFMVNQIFL
tara:strand:+ start:195 stop:554 length:360 start_codon:yes stop_codon:yes gene_type:complete